MRISRAPLENGPTDARSRSVVFAWMLPPFSFYSCAYSLVAEMLLYAGTFSNFSAVSLLICSVQ